MLDGGRNDRKTNAKSKEKFALVSSLALLLFLLQAVVILNFDAGTFCALPWLLLKIYTRAYLGTCFAILLALLLVRLCPSSLVFSPASQHVASLCSCSRFPCVVSHLYGHHKL